jgi:hypothetical protein
VAAQSKEWVYGRTLSGIAGSNPAGGHGCLSLVSVVCCQVEVSATSWSLVQRSPTDCGVSECDREASVMRGPWPTRGCCAIGKKNNYFYCYCFVVVVTQQLDLVHFLTKIQHDKNTTFRRWSLRPQVRNGEPSSPAFVIQHVFILWPPINISFV